MIFNHLLTPHGPSEDARPIYGTDGAGSLHAATHRERDNFTPFQLVLTQHQALFAPFIAHSTQVQI